MKTFPQSLWQYLINVKARNFSFPTERASGGREFQMRSLSGAGTRRQTNRFLVLKLFFHFVILKSIASGVEKEKLAHFVWLSSKACQQTSSSLFFFSPQKKGKTRRQKCVAEVKNAGSWASVGARQAIHDTLSHILPFDGPRWEEKENWIMLMFRRRDLRWMNEASPDWALVCMAFFSRLTN